MREFVFEPDRAEACLEAMLARFDAVAQRFHAVYGLRLPRHLAVFAAFLDAIGPPGRVALNESAGLSLGGITRYFGDNGLALSGRDGLDERLDCRFRCDPPEFVTVMWGNSDGLHFGLWFDDPAEPPSFVAHNYARDSAETWSDHRPTALAETAAWIGKAQQDQEDYGEDDEDLPELLGAVEAFAEADRQAVRQDSRSRWTGAAREDILGGIGVALPEGAGDPRGGYARSQERFQAYRDRDPQVRRWIDQAQDELSAGRPAFALVLGRELHWLDAADYRDEALRLMTGAYQELGRDALAAIAAVHYANRDLNSVDVLIG